MKTLQFTKEIKAPIQKVWDVLWNENTYPEWTNAFNPDGGSMMKSDWKVGGKTLFLDKKGHSGMVSTIKTRNEPYEIVFEHLGEVIGGTEDTTSEKIKTWAGSLEAYYLSENNGITTLKASIQIAKEWEQMMSNGFNKGLGKVKELSEKAN